jgi:hypothetical protein
MRQIVPSILVRANSKFYIIDANDKLTPSEMKRLFGKVLQGAAETVSVVRGRVKAESIGCPRGLRDSDSGVARHLALVIPKLGSAED